jgi:hypothetical protein
MATIAKTFPEIADLWMELTETGSMDFERDTRIIRKDRHNGYIGCSNPACQGGVNVLPIIDDMVRSRATERKATETCASHISMGRRQYQRCSNRFEITATITYKEDQQEVRE